MQEQSEIKWKFPNADPPNKLINRDMISPTSPSEAGACTFLVIILCDRLSTADVNTFSPGSQQ
jgi:hypothetical protein